MPAAFSADPSTKTIFLMMERNHQCGFVGRNYGSNLFTIATNEQVSFEDRLEIAILYVDEVRALFVQRQTHEDLKLENACYHNAYYPKGEKSAEEKVTLIDLDGMRPIQEMLSNLPIFTVIYLHPFFKDGNNIQLLCFGQYRLIHDLWAMTIACNQLIFRSNEFKSFCLEKLKEIDKLLVWVLKNPDKLSQDEMLKFVYEFSLEFSDVLSDILIDELDDYVQNSLAINSVENSPPAEKAEESKPDLIMQSSDEIRGSSVECVDKPGLNDGSKNAKSLQHLLFGRIQAVPLIKGGNN